jgi:hypothetical protein
MVPEAIVHDELTTDAASVFEKNRKRRVVDDSDRRGVGGLCLFAAHVLYLSCVAVTLRLEVFRVGTVAL